MLKVQAANLVADVGNALTHCLIIAFIAYSIYQLRGCKSVCGTGSKGYNLECTYISEQGSKYLGIAKLGDIIVLEEGEI